MKRIVITTLSVLILISLVLFFQVENVIAEKQKGKITLKSTYDAIAEWVAEPAKIDNYSVRLYWSVPYRDNKNNYITPRAFVDIDIPDGITIDSENGVSTWSYWAKSPKYYTPQLTFYVDHPDITNYENRDYDTTISVSLLNRNENWVKIDETTIPSAIYGMYVIWICGRKAPVYARSWVSVREGFTLWEEHYDYGNAEVKMVRIGKGTIGTNKAITAYVDDFELNGVVYEFEMPVTPTPALPSTSPLLLFLFIVFILWVIVVMLNKMRKGEVIESVIECFIVIVVVAIIFGIVLSL